MGKNKSKIFCVILSIIIIMSFSACSVRKDNLSSNKNFYEKSSEETLDAKDIQFEKTVEALSENTVPENENLPENEISQPEHRDTEKTDENPNVLPEEEKETQAESEVLQESSAPAEASESVNTCTISITCKEILENMDKLDKSKNFSIPDDGIILPCSEIEFTEGASVFDILLTAVKDAGIHMEFSKTPGTNSVYIEGIANIYEFDCGNLSGWMYTVNGEVPMISASDCPAEKGDNIQFIYVCSFFEGS